MIFALICFAVAGLILIGLFIRAVRRSSRVADTLKGMADWGGML